MVSRPRPDRPEDSVWRILERIDRLENAAPLKSSSVHNGRTRFVGNESILVEGSGKVDGWWIVTGTQRVTGRLEGSGTFDWSGPLFLRGNTSITGILQVTGATTLAGALNVTGVTTLNGDVTLNNDLSLGSGRFIAGSIVIDKNGGYGGRIAASTLLFDTSSALFTGAVTADQVASFGDLSAVGDLSVLGNSTVLGTKSFRMPHPLKDEHWLQHGCTESPVSGTEYTGCATIGEDGSAVVELPDYFEALNKPRNRTVQVTAIGRPFAVGAEKVIDGKVKVYGDPGRDVFWLVKAERIGGDFETESRIPPAPVSYD